MAQSLLIAIVTDAWHPQVNGVVRTLSRTREELEALGHRVDVLSPEGYRSIPCPTYPEILLALGAGRSIKKRLTRLKARCGSYCHRGPFGTGCTSLVSPSRPALYHQLSHPIPRIYSASPADSSVVELCLFKMVSWPRTSDAGCNTVHGAGTDIARLQKYWTMVTRCRS